MRSGSSTKLKVGALAVVVLLAVALGWWLRRGRDAGADAVGAESASRSPRSRQASPDGRLALPNLADEDKAAITGTVRTLGAGPIAGARVCVWPDAVELRGLGDGRPICTRTDDAGRYRIEGLWPVGVQLDASAAGHRPRRFRANDRLDQRPQISLRPNEVREVDLELESGGTTLRGVVKDIAGGEIEGALVISSNEYRNQFGRAVAITDADGRFELWTAPGDTHVGAWAVGYAETSIWTRSPSDLVELFLTPESVLVGRVVHAQTGEPVGDVSVSAGAWTRSDADGQFRIAGLPPGSYKPTAVGDNFYGVAATQVHLGLGQTSDPVEIRVHPAAVVAGKIVVAGSGDGCRAGGVMLVRVGSNEIYDASTDAAGEVIVRAVMPGEYEVGVRCEGKISAEDVPNLVVGSDNIVGQVWEVREGLAIRGVIVDAEGSPVRESSVMASMKITGDNARGQTSMASSRATEPDGTFELAGLLPGSYELMVFAPQPGPEAPIVVELEPGADLDGVRIELPATGSVHGRVLDERGVGQPNVMVEVSLLGAPGRSSSARTDDRGSFVIEHVSVGDVRVRALDDRLDVLRRPGSKDDDAQGETVSVGVGATAEVELIVEQRSGVIRGRVFDEDGAAVDDAFVHAERLPDSATASKTRSRNLVRWERSSTPHLSETDGSFEIAGLSEGTYVVRAHRKGGGEAIAEDVALGSSVDLKIAQTGVLAGVVRVEGQRPPERFTLTARDAKAGLYASDSFFRTDGRWELTGLSAGTYQVIVDSPAGNGELTVELEPGGVHDRLELVLTPRITLKGRLVDADTREPIPGYTAMVLSRGGWPGGMVEASGPEVSDAQGYFTVENAATGRVRLMFVPRTFTTTGGYGWTEFDRAIEPEPDVQDLGEIALVRERLEPGQSAGDLGYELDEVEPGVEAEDKRLSVGLIRPGGPADGTGLAVGDVIEAVDGKSVLGVDSSSYAKLTRVPAGTTIELTIAGDKQIRITLGSPRE